MLRSKRHKSMDLNGSTLWLNTCYFQPPAHLPTEVINSLHLCCGGAAFSLLHIHILTGRRHQIRSHLSHCGHPSVPWWPHEEDVVPHMSTVNATRRCLNKWNWYEIKWFWNFAKRCHSVEPLQGKSRLHLGISRCPMAFMLQLTSTLEIYRFVPRLMLSHAGSSIGWGFDDIECSQGCDSKGNSLR